MVSVRTIRQVLIRRGATLVVAVAVVAVSPVVASAATMKVEPRDRVYASYLPTVEQIDNVYPFLADGVRSVGRYRGLGADFSCWDWTQAFLAADGRWAFYTMKGGGMPFFKGLEDPAVFVFKFHTRAKAQDAYWQQERFVHRCMGRQSTEGTTARLWRQRIPFMGQGSIAYRLVQRNEVGNRFTKSRELHLAVLRGRFLVNVFNSAKHFQPDTGNGVRLARITLRNIG